MAGFWRTSRYEVLGGGGSTFKSRIKSRMVGQNFFKGLVRPRSQFCSVLRLVQSCLLSFACVSCCFARYSVSRVAKSGGGGESTLTACSNKWQKGRVTAPFRQPQFGATESRIKPLSAVLKTRSLYVNCNWRAVIVHYGAKTA